MSETHDLAANAAQIEYWNAAVGRTWVQFQAQLDRQIAPLGSEALRRLDPQPGERVLDVGCGCGQTTVDLAERLGREGQVVGVDISEPMLEVARARPLPDGAVSPTFLNCDAQTGDLGEAVFDAVFSRFGVMFFSDPDAAFANLCRSLKPEGRLAFVCWRPFVENPWMKAPMDAAQDLLPPLPPSDPLAPGPFAFADRDRVLGILANAGFRDTTVEPYDALIGGATVDEAVALAFRVGPLAAALRVAPELASRVEGAVRAALQRYETPEGVMMPAAVWIVQARR